jgi:hypothetical protein
MEPIPAYARVLGTILAVIAVPGVIATVLAGTVNAAMTTAHIHRVTTYTVGDSPRLSLDVRYGEVFVEVGDNGRIVVDDSHSASSITRAGASAAASQTQVRVSRQGNQVSVTETSPLFALATLNRSARLTVYVPVHTDLDVASVGLVTVAGVDGNIQIHNSYVRTVLHHVSIRGNSTIDGGFGDVELEDATVSGSLTLRSTNGDLLFAGSMAPGATTLNVQASDNGRVSIVLPYPTDARATITTSDGRLSADPIWRFNANPSGLARSWTADLGANPSGAVNVTTWRGNIEFGAR